MYSKPDRGSSAVCPYCAVKPRNGHSIKQSAECDGIKNGSITGERALKIRLKNGAKERKQHGSEEAAA